MPQTHSAEPQECCSQSPSLVKGHRRPQHVSEGAGHHKRWEAAGTGNGCTQHSGHNRRAHWDRQGATPGAQVTAGRKRGSTLQSEIKEGPWRPGLPHSATEMPFLDLSTRGQKEPHPRSNEHSQHPDRGPGLFLPLQENRLHRETSDPRTRSHSYWHSPLPVSSLCSLGA